jgi:hypothetical protein
LARAEVQTASNRTQDFREVRRVTMIKDVMVWLDGSLSDDIRLAAVADIARRFESHVIGLL